MSSNATGELFAHLGVEFLVANRYEPPFLGHCDVTRTLYYRRNRMEFDALARRYGPLLSSESVDTPDARERIRGDVIEKDAVLSCYENVRSSSLEIRWLGGLLGRALFSLNALSIGDFIGEYTGIVRPARPGRPLAEGGFTSDYAWGFPKVRSFGRRLEIDAREAGGFLRFSNHAANPSAYPEHFPWKGKWRIVFLARRPISVGEEITVDYGEAYWCGGERELALDDS